MKLASILAIISSFAVVVMAAAADPSLRRNSIKGSRLGRGKKANPNPDESSGITGVLIVIDGVTSQEGPSNDIVATCLVNAFNKIHKNANDDFELSDAVVFKSVVVPMANTTTANNNPTTLSASCPKKGCSGYQDIVWLRTGYHCRLCDPRRRNLSQVNFFKKDSMHKAFEAEFRNELIASGDEALAKVRRCDIDFTTPAVAAAAAASDSLPTKMAAATE